MQAGMNSAMAKAKKTHPVHNKKLQLAAEGFKTALV